MAEKVGQGDIDTANASALALGDQASLDAAQASGKAAKARSQGAKLAANKTQQTESAKGI